MSAAACAAALSAAACAAALSAAACAAALSAAACAAALSAAACAAALSAAACLSCNESALTEFPASASALILADNSAPKAPDDVSDSEIGVETDGVVVGE